MADLIITRGYAGAGKTRWSYNMVDNSGYTRVSRDDLRQMMFHRSGVLGYDDEQLITLCENLLVEQLLTSGKPVVVDATHLRYRHAQRWADLAKKLGVPFHCEDFEVDAETCIARDALRSKVVGPEVITKQALRWPLKSWKPVVPKDVSVPPLELYTPDPKLPPAYIFDLDGTLARMSPDRGPFEWRKVGLDSAFSDVARLLSDLSETASVYILSGRDSCCREETIGWLDDHNIWFDGLIMRPENDYRKDDIVKLELFDTYLRGKVNVLGVVDDRLSVCRLWHALGLTLYRVGDPDAAEF